MILLTRKLVHNRNVMIKLADRMSKLAPEGAFKVLAEAQKLERQGRPIIHFEIGQPDFETPKNIAQAAIKAIRSGKTKYTPSLGIISLRQAIAEWTSKEKTSKTDMSQVAVTPSCKSALFIALASTISVGDEVFYPDPGFPTYKILVEFFGGKAIPIPLIEEKAFSFDMDIFKKKISSKTKVIILNYPGNPTSTIIPKKDLATIADLALRFKCWVITDEIYSRILYTNEPYSSIYSLPKMPKQTIIVDGFSKTYSMTGWRLGWLVAPQKIMQKVEYLLTHSFACTSTFTQEAGLEAILGSQRSVKTIIQEFKKRRDFVIKTLNSIPGITASMPHGAFYAFPNIKSLGKTSEEIASLILKKANVALLAGTAFGQFGEGYLRISYATNMQNLKVGLERIKTVLNDPSITL